MVVRPRSNRRDIGHGDRMTGLDAREGSGRRRPNADTPHALSGGVLHETVKILREKPCRHYIRSARVEQVVARLHTLERACVNYLVQRSGFSQAGDAEKLCLPLLAQAL